MEHKDQNKSIDPMDHRSLGNKLKLFMFSDATPGMPFWLPAGAQLRKRLDDAVYRANKIRGYKPVISPAMMEDSMWKISGHYDTYKENMFPSEVEKRSYLLKPMNCPGHVIMYQHDVVSYKDLPKRYFEFGEVHRNENAGSLHGLFRVREFTQDDLHSFVMVSQVKDELIEHLDFIKALLDAFGFDYTLALSTRPEISIGSDDVWNKAESAIIGALVEFDQTYSIDEGGGSFYGPKLDIKIKDNHNREWQLGTIQVDFNLPERFGMKYVDENGKPQQPVMIHRAVLGSFERFIGIVLEHQKGLLPVWLSPHQVAIVPINGSDEKLMTYVNEVKELLVNKLGADIIVYDDNNTLNKRIKIAEQMKNPIIMVLGNLEMENKTVNLRHKIKQKKYSQSLDDFVRALDDEMQIII